jgi:hypothetical protein
LDIGWEPTMAEVFIGVGRPSDPSI